MTVRLDQVQRAFALLIGIDDYSEFDASARNPPGTSDLPAGRNDVRAFYRVARALGVPHDNIHVLTTPKLAPGAHAKPGEVMECGYMGEATRAEIEAQLAWLAGALAHAPSDVDAPVGLLAYSGHGDFSGGELALCPGDVRAVPGGGDLQNVIAFSRVRAILDGAPGAADNLTVVLDCCHAGASVSPQDSPRRGARTSLTGRTAAADAPLVTFGARMILATAPGQTARQSTFDGIDHGALTWALMVVTDQYVVQSEGDVDRFTITNGELCDRAQALLRALAFEQTIELRPVEAGPVLFFHRGAADARDVAAAAPDRVRVGVQLDPEVKTSSGPHDFAKWSVTITFKDSQRQRHSKTATVLAAVTPYQSYRGNTEYWYIPSDFMNAFETGNTPESIAFSRTGGSWPFTPPTDALAPIPEFNTSAEWSVSTSGPPATGVFVNSDSSGTITALEFGMRHGTTGWTGSLAWLQGHPTSSAGGSVYAISDAMTLTYQSNYGSPTNTVWYAATISPS